MNGPHLITRESIGSRIFEIRLGYFTTLSGEIASVRIYTVRPIGAYTGRERLNQAVWEARREAALVDIAMGERLNAKQYIDTAERIMRRKLRNHEQRKLARMHCNGVAIDDAVDQIHTGSRAWRTGV